MTSARLAFAYFLRGFTPYISRYKKQSYCLVHLYTVFLLGLVGRNMEGVLGTLAKIIITIPMAELPVK